MRFYLVILLGLYLSCGEETVEAPEPGKNASCVTYEKEGVIYHKCKTGDGLVTETSFEKPKDGKDGKPGLPGKDGVDGEDGRDGKDAIASYAKCEASWDTSEASSVEFDLLATEYSNGVTGLYLTRKYLSGEYSREVFTATAFSEDSEEKTVIDTVFTVSYKDCVMEIVFSGKNEEKKSVDCECFGGE